MSRLEPKAFPILADVRTMGVYAGLTPLEGATWLIALHEGMRKNALEIANRRAWNHPDAIVRKWWEEVAIAIEGWKDRQAARSISQADGHA